MDAAMATKNLKSTSAREFSTSTAVREEQASQEPEDNVSGG